MAAFRLRAVRIALSRVLSYWACRYVFPIWDFREKNLSWKPLRSVYNLRVPRAQRGPCACPRNLNSYNKKSCVNPNFANLPRRDECLVTLMRSSNVHSPSIGPGDFFQQRVENIEQRVALPHHHVTRWVLIGTYTHLSHFFFRLIRLVW